MVQIYMVQIYMVQINIVQIYLVQIYMVQIYMVQIYMVQIYAVRIYVVQIHPNRVEGCHGSRLMFLQSHQRQDGVERCIVPLVPFCLHGQIRRCRYFSMILWCWIPATGMKNIHQDGTLHHNTNYPSAFLTELLGTLQACLRRDIFLEGRHDPLSGS